MTGGLGRLGSALVAILRATSVDVLDWRRPDYDLDDPSSAARVVARDRPLLVYHAAAWTDTDACARQPELAHRRNAEATAELAAECAAAGTKLVFISTNEVFSGGRNDGVGYREDDQPDPPNAYGLSKLAGEVAAREAFAGSDGNGLWIARSSWLFGRPGADFPAKILAAADARRPDEALPVVADEFGRPTAAADLAVALVRLVGLTPGGTVHVAGDGTASRFEWAVRLLAHCRPSRACRPVTLAGYPRPSAVPPWGVLDTSRAEQLGIALSPWGPAVDAYARELCPA